MPDFDSWMASLIRFYSLRLKIKPKFSLYNILLHFRSRNRAVTSVCCDIWRCCLTCSALNHALAGFTAVRPVAGVVDYLQWQLDPVVHWWWRMPEILWCRSHAQATPLAPHILIRGAGFPRVVSWAWLLIQRLHRTVQNGARAFDKWFASVSVCRWR